MPKVNDLQPEDMTEEGFFRFVDCDNDFETFGQTSSTDCQTQVGFPNVMSKKMNWMKYVLKRLFPTLKL